MCSALFSTISCDTTGTTFSVKCSFMEIYMEAVRDLLSTNPSAVLRVHESPTRGVYVDGLIEETVRTPADILALVQAGEKNRVVAQTKMNSVSSRSHRCACVCVFCFVLKMTFHRSPFVSVVYLLSTLRKQTKRALFSRVRVLLCWLLTCVVRLGNIPTDMCMCHVCVCFGSMQQVS